MRESARAVLLPFLVSRLWQALVVWWTGLGGYLRQDAAPYLDLAGGVNCPYPMGWAPLWPLYPSLSWLLSGPLRWLIDPRLAVELTGLALSQGCCYLAMMGLFRWAAPTHGRATRAVWLLACWPYSLYLSCFSPHALGLVLCLGAFLAHRQGRAWESVSLAATALLAAPTGALALVVLALAQPSAGWLTLPALGSCFSCVDWRRIPAWSLPPAPSGWYLLAGAVSLGLTPLVARPCGRAVSAFWALVSLGIGLGYPSLSLYLFPSWAWAASRLSSRQTLAVGLGLALLQAGMAHGLARGGTP